MALRFYEKCISVKPDFIKAHFKKAKIFSSIGKHENSINELKKIIEFDNQNSKAFDLIGTELEQLNFMEEAKERYLDAVLVT